MILPRALPMALAATLAACGTPVPGVETATWQRCRSEARVHAASLPTGQPPGLPQPAALAREHAYLQPCLAPVLR